MKITMIILAILASLCAAEFVREARLDPHENYAALMPLFGSAICFGLLIIVAIVWTILRMTE